MFFSVFAINAIAGQAGFIYQGKEHVVYDNGKKVGQTFTEAYPQVAAQAQKGGRNPAEAPFEGDSSVIFFSTHEDVRCYRTGTGSTNSTASIRPQVSGSTTGLSCVKIR
jgi:hypothetical protein